LAFSALLGEDIQVIAFSAFLGSFYAGRVIFYSPHDELIEEKGWIALVLKKEINARLLC